jgi:protein tyrosine phosphatase
MHSDQDSIYYCYLSFSFIIGALGFYKVSCSVFVCRFLLTRRLRDDNANVAVVHCLAGRGRTGLVICAYLIYSGMHPDAELRFDLMKR